MATYTPLLHYSAHSMMMMKATGDPNTDGNWANVGGDVYFSQKRIVKSLWAFEDGSDIHVATQEDDGTIRYHVFDPGTDLWTTMGEFVVTNLPPQITSIDEHACSIALRSDGDVIILYAGVDGTDNAIYYARREGSTWTVDQQVDGAAATDDYTGAVVVLGASDRMHFFYKNDTDVDVLHRSLSSANALDTADQAVDASAAVDDHVVQHGVSYVSGATKVRVPYRRSSLDGSIAKLDSGANPTIGTDVDITESATKVVTPGSVACLSVDGTELHYLFAKSGDSDIFHDSNADDAGWQTDDEEKGAVTCKKISCNVYNRSGQKLAYVWLDNVTVKYNERDLAVANPPPKNRRLRRPVVLPERRAVYH